jgi:hypothetical protein
VGSLAHHSLTMLRPVIDVVDGLWTIFPTIFTWPRSELPSQVLSVDCDRWRGFHNSNALSKRLKVYHDPPTRLLRDTCICAPDFFELFSDKSMSRRDVLDCRRATSLVWDLKLVDVLSHVKKLMKTQRLCSPRISSVPRLRKYNLINLEECM